MFSIFNNKWYSKKPLVCVWNAQKTMHSYVWLKNGGSRALFTGPISNFFNKSNFKTGSHDTIHKFKNYFTTVFLVFINKRYPNIPLTLKMHVFLCLSWLIAISFLFNKADFPQKKKTLALKMRIFLFFFFFWWMCIFLRSYITLKIHFWLPMSMSECFPQASRALSCRCWLTLSLSVYIKRKHIPEIS